MWGVSRDVFLQNCWNLSDQTDWNNEWAHSKLLPRYRIASCYKHCNQAFIPQLNWAQLQAHHERCNEISGCACDMLHQSFCKHIRIQLANLLSCGAAALSTR